MKQQVNYLKHHKAVSLRISDDDITAIDVSVYNALFMLWNISGFESELSINRSEVMKFAKVGNKNTYTSSLHTLDEKGYIDYKPSHNPMIGSIVTLTIFGNSEDANGVTKIGKSGGKTTGKSSGNSGGTLPKHTNLKTQTNPVTPSGDVAPVTENSGDLKTDPEEKEKSSAQKEKTKHWKALVSEWHRFYARQFDGAVPSFDGEPASALKKLMQKIHKRVTEHPVTKDQEWTEGAAVDWLHKFLTKAWQDKWLRDNFLLTNLNSKFDSIVDRNGQSTSKTGQGVILNADHKRDLAERMAKATGQSGNAPG